jgi:hypothetical protein
MVTNLTTKQIESIQIDEGVIFLNYGLATQRLLAPTRGGGEFAATVTVRDIEFDGRHGKTTGTQVIEEQGASLKVTTLDMSQENLALAVPCCVIESDDGKTIRNPKTGVIGTDNYIENVTMFCKTIGGELRKSLFITQCTKRALPQRRYRKRRASSRLSLSLIIRIPTSTATFGKLPRLTLTPRRFCGGCYHLGNQSKRYL